MSQTILLLFASILIHSGGGPLTRSEVILFTLIAGALLLGAVCWGIVQNWIERKRGRNWPTISAVIDIVSVTLDDDNVIPKMSHSDITTYNASLTYVYRNPELQTGDYTRTFGNKEDAEAWANSYKGCTVTVHVDPHDPTNSILRKEDLDKV